MNLTEISFNQNFFFLRISVTNGNNAFSSPITVSAADLTRYTCTSSTCTQIAVTSSVISLKYLYFF